MTLYINTKDPMVVEVALKKDGQVIKSLVDHNEYGSQVLLPMIVKILKSLQINLSDIKEIEIEKGPGSYTGLKVGAAVAQAFGYVLNVPVNGKINKPIRLRYT